MNSRKAIIQFCACCCCTFFGCFFLPSLTLSQSYDPDKETGYLFTRHYTPKEYKNFPQNWAALQDSRGVMVFANGDGVLKFDGVVWEFHSLPNLGVVRSLAMDENGRVYIGAYEEAGYLDADSLGNYLYVSLLPHLNEEQMEFGNIYKTHIVNGSVIFQTDKGLLIWEHEKFSAINWPEEGGYRMSFYEDDTLYVFQNNSGLGFLTEGQIEMTKSGAFFKGKGIRQILSFNESHKLIVTQAEGLFLFNENEIIPFKTEIDDFLKKSILLCGTLLPDGRFALGTYMGGAFIIDRKGKVKYILNKTTGLGDKTVYSFCLDDQGALWATLSKGICRIEIQNPMSHFLENISLEGSVNAITRFQGSLYVGTTQGLYQLKPAELPDNPARFERVEALNTGIWGMANLDSTLLVNTDLGTFILENSQLRQINNYVSNSVYPCGSNPNIMFSALTDGLSILKKINGRWTDLGRVSGLEVEVADLEEAANGSLWISTFSDGIYLLQFPSKNGNIDYLNPAIQPFGEKEGLKIGYTTIHQIGERELFFVKRNEMRDQLYQFDWEKNILIEYNDFARDFGLDGISAYPVSEEKNGKFWIQDIDSAHNKIIVERKSDNVFDFHRISFSRLAGYNFRILYEENDIAWWGGHDGLVRMEISKFKNKAQKPFDLVINRIALSDDSLLFAGTNPPLQSLKFPYQLNSIRFEYAAAFYDNHHENRYQYFLEGFDDDWSTWTDETNKSYTRIPEGSYVFKVRGKNIYGEQSEAASYSFHIAAPWYRSWWAYSFYMVAAVFMMTGVVQWRLSRIRKEKEVLEKLVEERTGEVKAQSEQLGKQAIKLKELDEAKSHFFANISHEFRTPLTIIMGLLEDSQAKTHDEQEMQNYAVMQRSAKKLQNLINQLLDLSKLEAKQLKLIVSRGNIYRFLKSIASEFTSYAIQRSLDYQICIQDEGPEAFFDADKLEKIVSNLLSNAFKFTPEEGRIVITAFTENDTIIIAVEDTGPGIQDDQLLKIFDRFFQIDNSHTRLQEGAGIGLALTKELAELHHGHITVESKAGHGSIFKIILPIGKQAYAPEELSRGIIDSSEGGSFTTEAPPFTTENAELKNPEELPILLIVEDNPDLRHFIADHLKAYKIIEAANGQKGLNKARKYVPDLIISDIMMPEMDGVELCKQLKEDEKTSHIPVILLTAKADIESRMAGLQTGADDYITKPFHAGELQIRVKNLILQRENLKKRFGRIIILKPKDITITSPDEIFLQKVMAIIENHLEDSEFSMETFQKEVGMSRMQLHRKLKALTGHAAGEFVQIQRLLRAKDLLIKSGTNISDVCYQTGFTSLSYFSKCFKKQFGITPKEFAASQVNTHS